MSRLTENIISNFHSFALPKTRSYAQKKTKKKDEKRKKKFIEKQKSISENKEKNTGSKFFSYLVVFIISSIALIVLVDTFKTPLISVFPGLEIILFSLFETLHDIKLFIIYLF